MATPTFHFFIVCPPEVRAVTRRELETIWPYLLESDGRPHGFAFQPKEDLGGFEVELPLSVGLQLLDLLRTATRVLLRVAQFRAQEFFELERGLKRMALPFTGPFVLKVAAAKSHLGQEKQIFACAKKIFPDALSASENHLPQVYLRIHKDEATVSVDPSADVLFHRSDLEAPPESTSPQSLGALAPQSLGALAPLRESLAAVLVQELVADVASFELSHIHLLDVCCGTGTLLAEAGSLFQPVIGKKHLYQNWKNCPKQLSTSVWQKGLSLSPITWAGMTAMDIDAHALSRAKSKLANFPMTVFVESDFRKASIPSFEPAMVSLGHQLWGITNPPYGGERLQRNFSWEEFWQQLASWNVRRQGVLLSDREYPSLARAALAHGYQLLRDLRLKNGGIPVVFSVWVKSK